jgi:hypothetical protein
MSTLTLSDPIKCNLWRTVEVPNIIVYSSYYCKIENILDKLNPSSTYPFYGTQFSSQIDWEASSCQTEVILNGEYDSSKLYDLSELLINHCQNVIPLDTLPAIITDYRQSRARIVRSWKFQEAWMGSIGLELDRMATMLLHPLPVSF